MDTIGALATKVLVGQRSHEAKILGRRSDAARRSALVRSQFARANEMMGDVLYKPLLDPTMVFHMTITILGFSYDDNVETMGLYGFIWVYMGLYGFIYVGGFYPDYLVGGIPTPSEKYESQLGS